MKKYLTKFDTISDYNSFIEGSTKEYVNVSYIVDDDEVKYWHYIDYSKMYLTFEVVEAGTIKIGKWTSNAPTVTIQYSSDNGSTWNSITSSTTTKSLGEYSIGDKIILKGTNNTYGAQYGYNKLTSTAKLKVYGNIMSLIYGDNFIGQTTLPSNYTFSHLFDSSSIDDYANIIEAENLILPATTLTKACYSGLFYYTHITSAPKLPATPLAESCYDNMFRGG